LVEVAAEREGAKILSTTLSICPECNALIPADIIEADDRIYLKKSCERHGEFVELYFGSAGMYRRFMKYAHDGKGVATPNIKTLNYTCPFSCGLCPGHLSHTALANIVVTNRCDLACWYCLPPDEELLVKEGGRVELVKIGDLASKFFAKLQSRRAYEGEYVEPVGLFVLTFTDGKVGWGKVTKIFRRRYSGAIYRVLTRTGRMVRLTGDHRVIVVEDGRMKRVPVSDLKIGDKLLILGGFDPDCETSPEINLTRVFDDLPPQVGKKIYMMNEVSKSLIYGLRIDAHDIHSWSYRGFTSPLVSGAKDPGGLGLELDTIDHEIPPILQLSAELMEVAGYFISNGRHTHRDLRIIVSDEYVANRLGHLLDSMGVPYSWLRLEGCGKMSQLVIQSRLLRLIFTHVLKIRSGGNDKRLPRFIFNMPPAHRAALLSALFNGGGYVVSGRGGRGLAYATPSPGLARDMLYLLASLGIFARLHRTPMEKMTGARRDLYKIHISGRDLEKALLILRLKPSHLRKLGGLTPKRDTMSARFGDLLVDEVKEVSVDSPGGPQGYVYDLEIEDESHSFIAGDGILVSNCFFYAEKAGYVYEPSMEEIRGMVRVLRSMRPVAGNAVQLTGGEPCLRDDLPEIVRVIKEEGVDFVQLNTNGIRLAKDFEFFRMVREAGVSTLYLSFDGVSPKTNPKNHWEVPAVLDNARRLGVGIVLVPTIIRTINDHELGEIIRFGFRNVDIVRSVNFQPVSLVGKMPRRERERFRITIPDCIKLIEEQTDGQIPEEAWFPVPSCVPVTHLIEAISGRPQYELSTHFACGAGTYVFKDGDRMIPITDFVDVDGLLNFLQDLADRIKSGASKYISALKLLWSFRSFIDERKAPSGLNIRRMLFNIFLKHDYGSVGQWHMKSLFLGMMHFMDTFNYDVERVRRCSIHYLTPDGRIIPFCTFNVLPHIYRDAIQRKYGIPVEEWERRTGRKLKNDLYRYIEPSGD